MHNNNKVFTDNLILSKMGKRALTTGAIAEKCGCSLSTIARILPKLHEAGLVERLEIGAIKGKKIVGWYTELSPKKRKQELRG